MEKLLPANSQLSALAEGDFGEWASLYYIVGVIGGGGPRNTTAGRMYSLGILRWKKRLRKFELNRDLGLNCDGLIVEVVGLVLPLFDGIDCGVGQDGIAAQHFDRGDAAIPTNAG